MRVARRAFACALPRPSAIASAKFAKSTVSHSQRATVPVNQSGSCSPEPNRSRKKIAVVITLPSSTMKMTGLRKSVRGSSFPNESPIAARTISREKMAVLGLVTSSPRRGRGSARERSPRARRRCRASGRRCSGRSAGRRAPREAPHLRDARGLHARVRRRDVRVDPGAGRRDRVDGDVADLEARVVGALELEDRLARSRTALARSGFVGPRLANVVAAALYSGTWPTAADGSTAAW